MFRLKTRDGDVWEFEDLEETRRNQYIFGGKIEEIINKGDDNDSTDTI